MNNLEQLEATFDAKISPGVLKEAMKEAGASKGDLWKLPFDQLRIIDGFNLRVHSAQYTAKIEEYAETLFNKGWFAHKPMSGLVQRDEATGESQVFVFDGHTRSLSIPLANQRLVAADRQLISEVTVIAGPSKKNGKEPISMADLTMAMVHGNRSNSHS